MFEALRRDLASLHEQVARGAPSGQRDEALEQVAQLVAGSVAADEPEPGRLARVYRWFTQNAPDLAESVASLLLGPLVGKLVGGGAGVMAAALGADERQR
jgi:hypothetical protein